MKIYYKYLKTYIQILFLEMIHKINSHSLSVILKVKKLIIILNKIIS
jgi:hypothetical protein